MRRFIAIAFMFATSQAWAAFGYYSPISINAAQVPSTQTDFPVLVSVTDARFKTVGNGGHVQNSSGFDIRPYTDTTLSTAITGYELERYVATTGELQMWVKVSSLSSSTTPFVLAYGDATISTDGSSTTTWSNGFRHVYHVKDGTTLSVTDSTGTTNGTNHSATAAAGQVDGGAAFVSASTQYISGGTSGSNVAVTFSAWVKATSFPGAYNAVVYKNSSNSDANGILVKSNGKLFGVIVASVQLSYDGTGSHTLSTGTWYYVALTYSSSTGLIGYVNGASDQTVSANGAANMNTAVMEIGRDDVNSRYWNGSIDEVRMSQTVARSANWLLTEYNNQFAPGTFETLGTEASPSATNNGWFYFFP